MTADARIAEAWGVVNVRAGGVCEPQPHPFGAPPRQVDAWPACSPTTRAGPLVKLQDPLRRSAGSCGERTWATGMRAGMAIDKAAAGARAASSSVLASIGKARKVVSSRGLATTTFYFSVNNYVYTGGGKPLLVSPASAGLGRGGAGSSKLIIILIIIIIEGKGTRENQKGT